jgi:hypothetical protein
MRKNPENKMLEIVNSRDGHSAPTEVYIAVLSSLAIAESNLVRAGKDSAMPHFIAIVKELERLCDFKFKVVEEQ